MIRSEETEKAVRPRRGLPLSAKSARSAIPRIAMALGLAAVSLSVVSLSGSAAFADVNAGACGSSGLFASSSPETPVIDSCTYTASGNSVLSDTFTAPSGVASINVIAYGADGGGAYAPYGQGGEVSATLPVTQSVFQIYAGGQGGGETNQHGIGLPAPSVGAGGGGGGSGSASGGAGGLGGSTVLGGQGIPSYTGGSGGGGGGASTVYGNGSALIVAGGGGGEAGTGGFGYESNLQTEPGSGGNGEGSATDGESASASEYDSNPGTPGAGGIAAGSNYGSNGTTGGAGTAGLQNGGSGGGGGGGGGGGYSSGEGGGGGGGADAADPAGSGGGGGGGSSWATNSASNISLSGTNPNGEGQVIITWTQPPDTPTLSGSVSSSPISVGSPFDDTAVLSGGNVPTGSLTFELFGPNDTSCSNGTVSTVTVGDVSGDGSYTSGDFTPSSPGTYQVVIVYNGDANNNPVTDGCGSTDQSITANPLSQTITFSQPPVSPVLTGTTYAVSATSTSTAPVSLSIDSSSTSECTLTNGTVDFVAPGSCKIDGQVAAYGNYASDTSSQTVDVGQPQSSLFVASGGMDSGNDCASQSAPCATVSHALNEASPGATIELSGTIQDHLTVDASVTITGADAPANSPAVIDGNSNTSVLDIDTNGVTVHLAVLTVSGGNAQSNGGGIDNQSDDTLTVTDSTITNGTASSSGGGIYNGGGGAVTVSDSTVSSDTATNGSGGGIYNSNGTLDVTGSTFTNDDAAQNGGGIYNSSTADIADSTLTGNTASAYGGGIYNPGTMDVVATTIYDNSGERSALNIFTTGNLYMAASLIASPSGGVTTTECNGEVIDDGYNVADTTTCGLNQPTSFQGVTDQQIDEVEEFGTLASNGGPTQTVMPESGNPAVGLIPGSVTVAVDGQNVQLCPTTDQRGAPTAPGAVCAAGSVQPSILYVAQGGSDTSNACVSATTPCATLSHALGLPGSVGTTIEVSGTIHDSVTIPASVTITGADAPAGEPAVIDNNNSGGSVFYIPNPGESVNLNQLTMTAGTTPYGGGINIAGSGDSVQVSDSTISGNTASDGGAGIHDNGSNLTVTGSTISDNKGGPGGGIYITSGSTVSIVDSTIADNSGTSSGGGLYITGGSVSLVQSTLAGNTVNAGRDGAAIYATDADVSLAGSIVADPAGAPTGGECENDDPQATFSDDGYNTVDDTSCDLSAASSIEASTVSQADAIERLGTLADNGGTTQTVQPLGGDPATDIIPNSTAVNVNGSTVTLCPTVDQRGDSSLAGTSCDAGSVQTDPTPTVTAVSPGSSAVTGGTTITVVGTGFVSGSALVDLVTGKTPALVATNVKVVSPIELTALTPTGGKVGKNYYVEVVTPGGTSATNKSASLTYLPAPTATKISPAVGPASGGTVVTITGSEFVKGSTVDFGSVPAHKVTYVSTTSLRAVSPAGSAGSVKVTVTTPSGTSKAKLTYTYDPKPTVTSVSPAGGPVAGGTLVTVDGSGFVHGATVEIGLSNTSAVRAVHVDVISSGKIQLDTGRSTKSGRMTVWVVTPGGVNSSGPADIFNYTKS